MQIKSFAVYLLVAGIWIYFVLLFGWLVAYFLTGDRIGLVSLLNLLAVYWFLPLPLVIVANLFLQQRAIWVAAVLGLVAFLWLWGDLFLPSFRRSGTEPSNPGSLKVMTFNALGRQNNTSPQIAMLKEENADVVLIQELNQELAQAIHNQLLVVFPYQILKPGYDVEGMGILSKFPLKESDMTLPLSWTGPPLVAVLNWHENPVILIDFHSSPTTARSGRRIGLDNQRREAQARVLAEAAKQEGSVIVAGDANATPMNTSYRILAGQMVDSWKEAGFGLGHTFPGSDVPGSSRSDLWGVRLPMWLARIDYIFHTRDLQAVSARMARFDGASDHRGVIAVLKRVQK